MRSLLRTLRFGSSARFSAFSSQPPLVQLVLQGDCGPEFALLLGPLSGHRIASVTVLPSSISIALAEQSISVHISLNNPGRDLRTEC